MVRPLQPVDRLREHRVFHVSRCTGRVAVGEFCLIALSLAQLLLGCRIWLLFARARMLLAVLLLCAVNHDPVMHVVGFNAAVDLAAGHFRRRVWLHQRRLLVD
jgi:hypothetical protein